MTATDTSSLTVLLIEDDPDHRLLITRAIKGIVQESDVHTANDGATALAQMRSAELTPDVILLDLNMPGLSGFDVLREVKADPQLMMIPVAMLTSSDLPTDIARAYERGANGYVSKPSYLHDLRAVLGNVLRYCATVKRAAGEGLLS